MFVFYTVLLGVLAVSAWLYSIGEEWAAVPLAVCLGLCCSVEWAW